MSQSPFTRSEKKEMASITPYFIHHTEKEKNNYKDFRLATRFYARKERGWVGANLLKQKGKRGE
jgi:hypothetical protein